MAKTKAEIQADYSKRSGYAAQKKYDAENTVFIGMKLNSKTDADILAALEGKAKQTEIKRLLRVALAAEGCSAPCTTSEE